jgi:hypothetical protein
MSDDMLLATLDELAIPHTIIGGSLPDRLARIAELHGLPAVMGVDEAIARAQAAYALLDVRSESERVAGPA